MKKIILLICGETLISFVISYLFIFSWETFSNVLLLVGCVSIIWGIPLTHTFLGHNASINGSNPINHYNKVRFNMKYGNPDNNTTDWLIAGVVVFLAGICISFLIRMY